MDFTDIDGEGLNWNFEGGSLKSFDGELCLDVTSKSLFLVFRKKADITQDGVDADGTPLQVFSCTAGNTNQQWAFNSNFSIQWKNHNKCVDLTGTNEFFVRGFTSCLIDW